MELDNIKNSWKQENQQIVANVHLNRTALMKKISAETNRMKRKNLLLLLFRIPFPVVILAILFSHIHIHNMVNFYIGIVLFLAFACFASWGLIKYYLNLRKLDITDSYLENKKTIRELELYKLNVTKRNYYCSPVGIAGIFLMINAPLFTTTEGAVMLLLIMAIMAASIFINLKYVLPAQFKRLNKEMEEIRKMEEE